MTDVYDISARRIHGLKVAGMTHDKWNEIVYLHIMCVETILTYSGFIANQFVSCI